MNRELLPKNFIKKHPLKEYSAAMFADLNIRLVHADELNAEIDKIVIPRIERDRREAILQGKKHIEEIKTAEEIVAQMRKKNEMSVIPLLCKKALTIQDEVMPLVLRRYKTTIQDHFIETAVRLFGNADRKYAIDLFHQYHEIRNEYARSMACLLFGEQNIEESIPLLLSEYERFMKSYPEESYDQGPLFALHILCGEA